MGARKRQTVYKRGNVYWHRDPITGQRKSTGYRSKKAAEVYHAQRELESADPHHAAKEAATLGEWVVKVLKAKRSSCSAGTANMYSIKAGHLVRIFGAEFPLRDLSAGKVDDYIQQRRDEGAGQSTIYREITVTLNQIVKAAKRAQACDVDVRSMMPDNWSNAYKPRKRNLTHHELDQILGAITEEQGAFVAFLVSTGSRHSEAMAAEPEDLDRADMVCRIRGTKTVGSARYVPVLPHFGALWLRVTAFWTKYGRAPRWKAASHGIGYACKRLGLPHATPNDLRRTHASWLIQAGVQQALVSRCLGHLDQTMVARVYGQMTGKQLAQLVSGQISDGTIGTQSPFFADLTEGLEAKNSTRPLGGIGRRRGFKIRSGSAENSQTREIITVETGGDRWGPARSGTNKTQSGRLLSPLGALAAAAHRLGILPGEAT